MKQAQSDLIAVHVYPQSGKNAVEGLVTDASGKEWLKVRLTATPEGGKANKALVRLLAKEWKCPPSALTIISGELSRYKIIRKN